jgi:hypothetical protein
MMRSSTLCSPSARPIISGSGPAQSSSSARSVAGVATASTAASSRRRETSMPAGPATTRTGSIIRRQAAANTDQTAPWRSEPRGATPGSSAWEPSAPCSLTVVPSGFSTTASLIVAASGVAFVISSG